MLNSWQELPVEGNKLAKAIPKPAIGIKRIVKVLAAVFTASKQHYGCY
jgi:hypothetical protein